MSEFHFKNISTLKNSHFVTTSDGWSDRIDVAKDYYEEAVGSFSIKPYSPPHILFNIVNYFTKITFFLARYNLSIELELFNQGIVVLTMCP